MYRPPSVSLVEFKKFDCGKGWSDYSTHFAPDSILTTVISYEMAASLLKDRALSNKEFICLATPEDAKDFDGQNRHVTFIYRRDSTHFIINVRV